MSSSVLKFFTSALFSPASKLCINYRERSTSLGDALVQSAIEYNIKSRLSSGLITLVNPRELENQLTEITSSVSECSGCSRVRCLILNPIPPRMTVDIVKSALLREKVKFFCVRKLFGGALEVTVEDSDVVNNLLKNGLVLYNNWYTKVRDASVKRCHTKYARAVCFLCHERGHVHMMCMRQVPDRKSAIGG